LSAFGHIARLTPGTPAHNALHCQAGVASSRSLGGDWNDTGSVPDNLWRQTDRQIGRPFYGVMVERRDSPS